MLVFAKSSPPSPVVPKMASSLPPEVTVEDRKESEHLGPPMVAQSQPAPSKPDAPDEDMEIMPQPPDVLEKQSRQPGTVDGDKLRYLMADIDERDSAFGILRQVGTQELPESQELAKDVAEGPEHASYDATQPKNRANAAPADWGRSSIDDGDFYFIADTGKRVSIPSDYISETDATFGIYEVLTAYPSFPKDQRHQIEASAFKVTREDDGLCVTRTGNKNPITIVSRTDIHSVEESQMWPNGSRLIRAGQKVRIELPGTPFGFGFTLCDRHGPSEPLLVLNGASQSSNESNEEEPGVERAESAGRASPEPVPLPASQGRSASPPAGPPGTPNPLPNLERGQEHTPPHSPAPQPLPTPSLKRPTDPAPTEPRKRPRTAEEHASDVVARRKAMEKLTAHLDALDETVAKEREELEKLRAEVARMRKHAEKAKECEERLPELGVMADEAREGIRVLEYKIGRKKEGVKADEKEKVELEQKAEAEWRKLENRKVALEEAKQELDAANVRLEEAQQREEQAMALRKQLDETKADRTKVEEAINAKTAQLKSVKEQIRLETEKAKDRIAEVDEAKAKLDAEKARLEALVREAALEDTQSSNMG